jgi:putative nucleotidyltransferase with HDIG domain
MQTQPAILKLSEAERPMGDRLLKIAVEIDRIEGYNEPHSVMIARLAERLGSLMGLHGTDLTALKYAALLHDIGERVMKRNYLMRPDDLTWEETLDLWRHPILGEQAASELKLARQVQLLIRWHHEWWNGQGYPDGLAGEMIPLGARILRAVDSYCALVSRRPHRRRYDALEAEQIIADLAGIEFDPQVAKKLVALLAKERGLQEVTTPSAATETAREPIAAPVVMQPAIVAAEYQPEPEILEPIPVVAQADPQIVVSATDAQDNILLIDEPKPVLIVEAVPSASEERIELSSALPELPVLEESDPTIWAEPSEAPPEMERLIEETAAKEDDPLELEKQ